MISSFIISVKQKVCSKEFTCLQGEFQLNYIMKVGSRLDVHGSVHHNTECPTRYRTRHFFNNFNTNEDIVTKFEQEYVRCVRNVRTS
jgi:hypothetical protein